MDGDKEDFTAGRRKTDKNKMAAQCLMCESHQLCSALGRALLKDQISQSAKSDSIMFFTLLTAGRKHREPSTDSTDLTYTGALTVGGKLMLLLILDEVLDN